MNDIHVREEFLRRIYVRQVPNLYRFIQFSDEFLLTLEEAGVLSAQERSTVQISHPLPGLVQLRRILSVYRILEGKRGFFDFLLFLKSIKGNSKDLEEVFKYFETEVSNCERIRGLLPFLE